MLAISHNQFAARERISTGLVSGARIGFAGLLVLSPFSLHQVLLARPVANIFSGYTDFSLFASDLFLLLTLGSWLISLTVAPRTFKSGPWFLTWPLVGLVALSWIGVLTGIDPALTLYRSVRFTLLLGLYFFLANERLEPFWVALPLSLGVCIQALIAFGQFVAQHSLGLASFGELALDPHDSGTSILRVGDMRILRAYALTEHPNILGGFIAFSLVILLGAYIGRAGNSRARYLLLVPLAVGGVGLLLTFSRAAAIAFLGGATLVAIIGLSNPALRSRRILDIGIAALVVIAASAIPILANRDLIGQRIGEGNSFQANPVEQRSLAEREALLASANRVFYKHELLGVGNGALPLAMYEFDDQFQKEFYYQPAHFVLIDAAAELGIVGGMIWLWLLVTPALALWHHRRDVLSSPWVGATAAALLVVTIIGFYDYYPWLGVAGSLWQWSAWGLFGASFQATGRTSI